MPSIAHHPKFDFLRGAASFVVLAGHGFQIFVKRLFPETNHLPATIGLVTKQAVYVFFLLSGFLITSSILNNLKRNGRFGARDYLVARVTRIYPPLIGTIGVVFVCWLIIHALHLPGSYNYGLPTDHVVVRDRFDFGVRDALAALTMSNGMLQTNGALWTLNIEFLVYVAALFAALALTRPTVPMKIASLLLLVGVCRHANTVNPDFLQFASVWMFGSWGAAVASGAFQAASPPKRALLYGFGALIVALGIKFSLGSSPSLHNALPILEQLGFCLAYLYLIFFFPPANYLTQRHVAASGGFSYSLYIIHYPLMLLAYSVLQNWMGASLLKSFVAAGFAGGVAVALARPFANFFEDQSRFKPWIRKAFSAIP